MYILIYDTKHCYCGRDIQEVSEKFMQAPVYKKALSEIREDYWKKPSSINLFQSTDEKIESMWSFVMFSNNGSPNSRLEKQLKDGLKDRMFQDLKEEVCLQDKYKVLWALP